MIHPEILRWKRGFNTTTEWEIELKYTAVPRPLLAFLRTSGCGFSKKREPPDGCVSSRDYGTPWTCFLCF